MKLSYWLLAILLLNVTLVHAQKTLIDSLESIVANNQQDVETAKAMNLLAVEYSRTDTRKAKQYSWIAISLGRQLQHDRTLSSAYSQLVSLYQNEARADSAQYYLALLGNLSAKATGKDTDVIQGNYFSTAGLYYKKQAKFKMALNYFTKAYQTAQKTGNINAASGQAINIGNSYLGLSNFNAALKYYLLALDGFEKTGNKKGQSFCYQNIGECYTDLKQYPAALKYINRSIQLKNEMADKRGLGNAEQALGRIYTGMKDYDNAFAHFTNALSKSRELKILSDEVKIYYNLGKLFSDKGDTETANSYFEKSRKLATEIGDSTTVITAGLEILANRSNVLKQEETEKKALQDIESLKTSGMANKEAEGYRNLAEYYTGLKQYDKALAYTNRYHALNDSIKNTEIQARFKSIEAQYNLEKNEKQIALLKKDQQLDKQQLKQQRFLMVIFVLISVFALFGIYTIINRNRLKQKMRELELRNEIAADLHDEVGSSLSSINLLSQMALQQNGNAAQDILNKVSINANETMEKMSDIVWMIKPVENDGVGLMEKMERFAYDYCNSRNITCHFIADDLNGMKLTMHQKKNLYLIFKEAINNAVKYSGTSRLDVKITGRQKQLEMHITDYGKGFDETIVLKGNGLSNMQVRASELKGKLMISSEHLKGTQLRLHFPLV